MSGGWWAAAAAGMWLSTALAALTHRWWTGAHARRIRRRQAAADAASWTRFRAAMAAELGEEATAALLTAVAQLNGSHEQYPHMAPQLRPVVVRYCEEIFGGTNA